MASLALAFLALGAWLVGGVAAVASRLAEAGVGATGVVAALVVVSVALLVPLLEHRLMRPQAFARSVIVVSVGVRLHTFFTDAPFAAGTRLDDHLPLAWSVFFFAQLLVASPFLRRYHCSGCDRWRRTLFSPPPTCPGTDEDPHDDARWICPTCARASSLCSDCVADHGCRECRRDLSDQPRCPGPIDQPSQCLSSARAGGAVHLCPTHSRKRCPTCAEIGGMIARGRPVAEGATCSLDGEGAGFVVDGVDLGPVYRCYDADCNAVGHAVCLEGDGAHLCPKCDLRRYRVPRPGDYAAPSLVLRASSARVVRRR